MKNVYAEFSIISKSAMIVPPDAIHDRWGKFAHPQREYWGVFSFDDGEGHVELTVKNSGMFEIRVSGELPDEVIDSSDPSDLDPTRSCAQLLDQGFDFSE